MTDKERLEEIEAKYSTLTVRVQELEERDNEITKIYGNQIAQMSKLENENINLQEQNRRYREYLELIKTIGTYGKDIKTGEIIRSDEANLADEALEGEE